MAELPAEDGKPSGWTNINAYRQFLANEDRVLGFVHHVRALFYPDSHALSLDQARVLSCGITCVPEYLLYRHRLGWNDRLPEFIAAAVKSFAGMNKLLYWCTAQNIMMQNSALTANPDVLLAAARTNDLFWDHDERCPISRTKFLEVADVFCAPSVAPEEPPFDLHGLNDYAVVADRYLNCSMARFHLAMALVEACEADPQALYATNTKAKILNYLEHFSDEKATSQLQRKDALDLDMPELWLRVNRLCRAEMERTECALNAMFPEQPCAFEGEEIADNLVETPFDRLAALAEQDPPQPSTR
ncbi:hypothetical protein EOI86_11835 [Hwanghaeella grinnelliae]|uniref:Uncharacterized protein n=1 Tax=Hwanghaeella grinnelliae TaxID=2500179 RepID=A0A437QN64_9PROT|nr:hypothetical protein [Hwanghaeella grinnelliae]RVU35937.1 hypothetical protein EOI86_11835 [Hwanghaeella grinnelliae]